MGTRVKRARYVRGYVLELEFSDGSCGRINFRRWLTGRAGLFAAFEDVAFFRRVRVDDESGTLMWPNGVDLCPDVLHHRATGAALPGARRRQATNTA